MASSAGPSLRGHSPVAAVVTERRRPSRCPLETPEGAISMQMSLLGGPQAWQGWGRRSWGLWAHSSWPPALGLGPSHRHPPGATSCWDPEPGLQGKLTSPPQPRLGWREQPAPEARAGGRGR